MQCSNQFVDGWPSHLFEGLPYNVAVNPYENDLTANPPILGSHCRFWPGSNWEGSTSARNQNDLPIYPQVGRQQQMDLSKSSSHALRKEMLKHIMANPAAFSHQGYLAWVFNLFTIKWHGLVRWVSSCFSGFEHHSASEYTSEFMAQETTNIGNQTRLAGKSPLCVCVIYLLKLLIF